MTAATQDSPTHLWVQGTPEDVRSGLIALRAHLIELDVPADARDRTELVAAEIFNNVVEHALVDMQEAGFSALIDRRGDRIHIQVVDEGKPLPGGVLPEREMPDIDVPVSDLPEGGFGWALVRTLTVELRYDRDGGRNHLEAVLDIFPTH